MSGVTILINKADNTLTICIEKDFHKWAGSPRHRADSFGLISEGQANLNWINEQVRDFLDSQWKFKELV